ncbi:hypothetical protein RCO28_32320 [Streptomyces sp. LHD-70]|uniref:hypothetical protein n=1 Tax=Streptomyces sp. LHD-70 TaxID=3072140 RepID=UPI00280E5876|nr:hypothetical protein [Streptomyces sp. LHD-70]MDQ8707124.1 hypothetical protein [Streptomyces sp. LHD-70]
MPNKERVDGVQYESPGVITPASAAEDIFRHGRPEEVSRALITAALSGENRLWTEQWIIQLSRHNESSVRCSSAVSLGHLARLHGEVSQEAMKAVAALRGDGATVDAAGSSLEDIEIFCRK